MGVLLLLAVRKRRNIPGKERIKLMGRMIDRKKGGMVPKTGAINAHKGEYVVPAAKVEEIKKKKKSVKKNAPFSMF